MRRRQPMRSSTTDIAAGAFALFSVAIFYAQITPLRGLARDYPIGLLVFISLGGLYLLGKGIYKRCSGHEQAPGGTPLSCGEGAALPCSKEPGGEETVAYGRVAVILVLSLAYVYLMTLVGFYIASVIFLFASAMILSDVKDSGGWLKLAFATAIFTAVMCISVWIVFVKFLYVPTPVGELIWMLKDLR